MDSFRGHLTQQISHTCNVNNIKQVIIPGGMTSHCQPLDISVNRSFKSHLTTYYRKYGLMMHKTADQTCDKFNLDVLTKAIKYSWNRIQPAVITNGFRKMREYVQT
jgi:hypothetical protein